MKTPLTLLLTNDPRLEDSVASALRQSGGISHLAHCACEALQIVCGVGRDLDLALIDFESGSDGLALLSAISARREDLPVVVITRNAEEHVEALAYANGARACLPKPVTPAQIVEAMNECKHIHHQTTPPLPNEYEN